MGLRNWSSNDDPWIQHVRFNPKCAYVQSLVENKADIEKVIYIYRNFFLLLLTHSDQSLYYYYYCVCVSA